MAKGYRDFKKEVKRLIKKSGTGGGWEINFTKKEQIGNALARCTYNVPERWVRFSFDEKKKNKAPKRSAKHEFCHFLLARTDWLSRCRFVTDSEMNEESEKIARIMEKLIN